MTKVDLLSFWGPPTSALDCGAFYFFDFVFTGCQSNYDYGRFRSFNGLIKFPLQYAECARSLGQLSHAGKQSDIYSSHKYVNFLLHGFSLFCVWAAGSSAEMLVEMFDNVRQIISLSRSIIRLISGI